MSAWIRCHCKDFPLAQWRTNGYIHRVLLPRLKTEYEDAIHVREELSVAEADIQLNNYLSTVSTRQLARVYLTAPRGSLVSPLATDDAVNEHTGRSRLGKYCGNLEDVVRRSVTMNNPHKIKRFPEPYPCRYDGPVQMMTFFKFMPVTDPDSLVERIRKAVVPYDGLMGTMYVASEGVNAQFSVPIHMKEIFLKMMDGFVPGIKINFAEIYKDYERRPFKKLCIRTRKQVLTDKLTDPLDLSPDQIKNTMTAQEWHEKLQQGDAVVLDCRNDYESGVGAFQGAVPLNTTSFSDSWKVLDDIISKVDPTKPVLTYCTGGIRCVKVEAYVRQRLNHDNVWRLDDGIVGYRKWLTDNNKAEEDLFLGKNYVFDDRITTKPDGVTTERPRRPNQTGGMVNRP